MWDSIGSWDLRKSFGREHLQSEIVHGTDMGLLGTLDGTLIKCMQPIITWSRWGGKRFESWLGWCHCGLTSDRGLYQH